MERVRPALACGSLPEQTGSRCLAFAVISMDGCVARLPGDCKQRTIAKSPAAQTGGLKWPSSCSSCLRSRSRTLPWQTAQQPAWHSYAGWQTCKLCTVLPATVCCSPFLCAMPAEPRAAQTILSCSGSWNSWWPFRLAWVRPLHPLAATVVTIIVQTPTPATPLCPGQLTGQAAAGQPANGSSDLAAPAGAPSQKMLLPWEAQPAPLTPAAVHREQMQVRCAAGQLCLGHQQALPPCSGVSTPQAAPLASPLMLARSRAGALSRCVA